MQTNASMKAELSRDFQTGDITILIPDGIKITSRDITVTKIKITEEALEDMVNKGSTEFI